MQRENIHEAAKLEKELERLERDRWVIAHLNEVTFRIEKARDNGPGSDDQGGIPPEFWTLRMRVELAPEEWPPVKAALCRVYDEAIRRTKEQMRKLGVDPEDDL